MVKSISRDLIRKYLDDLNYSTRVDDDGDIFTILRADKDFNHDVIIFFTVDKNWLGIYGYAIDYDVDSSNMGRVMLSINEYNKNSKVLKAYLENNHIRFEQFFLLDEEVSEEYIKANCIKLTAGLIWKSFCDFNK